jgi:hypothetical protein
VFCATKPKLPLLDAKLKHGFPHYLIELPARILARKTYYLCRYNIARTRRYRGAKQEPKLDQKYECYSEPFRLPVANTDDRKRAMLQRWSRRQPLDVLVKSHICLGTDVRLIAFSGEDRSCLHKVARALRIEVEIVLQDHASYARCPRCVAEVNASIDRALEDARWKGDGLDYDSFRH